MSGDPFVERSLLVLNEALKRDPVAMTKLVNARIECAKDMAGHPSLQVGVYNNTYKIGMLGVLNGILGFVKGGIGAVGDVDPATGRFVRIRRFELQERDIAFDA